MDFRTEPGGEAFFSREPAALAVKTKKAES
jgi:hypothetical protein